MFFFRTSAPLSDLAVWSRVFFFFFEKEAARTSRRNLEGEGRTLPVALREDVGCNTWEISYFLSPPVGPFVWFRLWFLGGTEGLLVREREISFFNAPLHFGADLATLGLFCRTPRAHWLFPDTTLVRVHFYYFSSLFTSGWNIILHENARQGPAARIWIFKFGGRWWNLVVLKRCWFPSNCAVVLFDWTDGSSLFFLWVWIGCSSRLPSLARFWLMATLFHSAVSFFLVFGRRRLHQQTKEERPLTHGMRRWDS